MFQVEQNSLSHRLLLFQTQSPKSSSVGADFSCKFSFIPDCHVDFSKSKWGSRKASGTFVEVFVLLPNCGENVLTFFTPIPITICNYSVYLPSSKEEAALLSGTAKSWLGAVHLDLHFLPLPMEVAFGGAPHTHWAWEPFKSHLNQVLT